MLKVMVLSTPGCSICIGVKRMLERIKKEIPMNIEEYDVLEHPELLRKYPFLSSPGLVINGKLEFTGMPDEKELKKKLIEARK